MSYSHEWGVQRQTFFGPAPLSPLEGSKDQKSFYFSNKVIFKDFYTNFVWTQNISDRILFYRLCHDQGVGLWGAGCPGGQKKIKHGHVAYQIDMDDEQNRMQVKFSP